MLRHPRMSAIAGMVLWFALNAAAAADPWPGGQAASAVDVQNALGGDVSGLLYESAGTRAPGVLWTVDNGNSRMDRLVRSGGLWVRDTANGWSAGKTLYYPDGTGRPDVEGVTMTDAGVAGGVFVSSESNISVAVSRNSILRYDVSGAGATLNATREWNLTADLPSVNRNLGAESITWIPDAYLVAAGFVDQQTGQLYNPANYPNHGSGLFFIGLEANGIAYGYALDLTSAGFTRIASFDSGLTTFQELHWDPNKRELWVWCDNSCSGRGRVFRVDRATGAFTLAVEYARPTGLPNYNNEGFTFTTDSECVGGKKPVFWSDDDNNGGRVLWAGTIDCATPKNDLLADFGAAGLSQRMNNATSVKVHSQSPTLIATGDLDGDARDEAIASFAGGVYARYGDAAPWVKLDSRVPTALAAGNVDGTAGSDVVANFGQAGLWVYYNNAAWTKVHSQSPSFIATGDLDDDGKSEVIASFAGGLYARYANASPWVKLDARVPVRFVAGDVDGVAGDDVVADFGADGIWIRYNNATWTKVNASASQGLAIGDVDGDGRSDVLANLGASGLWVFLNNTAWSKIHSLAPVYLTTADLDGDGKSEAVADFGANRLYARYRNAVWTKLQSATSQGLAGGGFD